MVKKITQKGREYYMCGCCGVSYTDEKLAKECEGWGKKNGKCDINKVFKKLLDVKK